MKRIVSVVLAVVMAAALFAVAPAAQAETVQMGSTIVIGPGDGINGYSNCSKRYIDINMDLYGWGFDQKTPRKILSNVVSVKVGGNSAVALTADGELYDILGSYTNYGKEPKRIFTNVRVFEIVGSTSLFVITENGDLYTMGNNYWGECGTGEYNRNDLNYYTPQLILTGVKTLKCDDWSAYSICDSGNYFWGVYEYGKVGLGLPSDVPTTIVDNGLKTEVILKPTKMDPPTRYSGAPARYSGPIKEIDVQKGTVNDYVQIGGTSKDGFKYDKGKLYYKDNLIMTNVQWYIGDAKEMCFFTKNGELYYGSVDDNYCIKLADNIAMPYEELTVGTPQYPNAIPQINLPLLDKRPITGSLDNFKKTGSYPAGKFKDVSATAWYAENVKEAYELNLVKGVSATAFNPNGNITVAEAVTLAARLHRIYCERTSYFVPSTPWYQTYLDYAFANNILDRTAFQGADYNVAITRGEFANILAAAFPEGEGALEPINDIPDGSLPDVSGKESFGPSVYLLYRAGVLAGNDEHGTFAPDSNIKRSEVAAIVTRMAEKDLRKNVVLK